MYQKIRDAWEEDGDIYITTQGSSSMTIMLKEEDIVNACKEKYINIPRSPRTRAQKMIFCRKIFGNVIDVSSLGGSAEKNIHETMKDVKEMAKTKKVEWKIYGVDRNKVKVEDVQEALVALKPELEKSTRIGKNFKTWIKVKLAKLGEEKDDELEIIGSFDKTAAEKEAFSKTLADFSKQILGMKVLTGATLESCEVKE